MRRSTLTSHIKDRWLQELFVLFGLISVLFMNYFQHSALLYNTILDDHFIGEKDPNLVNQSHENENGFHFRYRGMRLNKDLIRSNDFLLTELRKYSRKRHGSYRNAPPRGQLIVGRWGGSEQEIMDYSDLPSNTTRPIPLTYVNPGYYFLANESTFESQRQIVQQWGRQRRAAYAMMNVFGVFDWVHRPDQIRGIERDAPNTGWLHAGALYPPCLPIFDTHYDVPWTEGLRGKTILIVHPFIDTIRQQIPKLPQVWSKVRNITGAPSSCLPIENAASVKFVRARLPVANPTQSWLAVLEDMKREITDQGPFDVALVSCGGFGLPLLAHIASLPHRPSGIYAGGALQLYFGIHGSRWNSENAGYQPWKELYTEAWTWPLDSDVSFSTIGQIEDSSYVKPGQGTGNAL